MSRRPSGDHWQRAFSGLLAKLVIKAMAQRPRDKPYRGGAADMGKERPRALDSCIYKRRKETDTEGECIRQQKRKSRR